MSVCIRGQRGTRLDRWLMVLMACVAAALGSACGADPPTAPSVVSLPSVGFTSPQPAPPPPSLPPGEPAATYIFSSALDYPVRDFTERSQYLLYDSGEFALRYEDWVYLGSYQLEDGRIIFHFLGADGGVNQDGQPDATGTLNGDRLEVRYTALMQHADYENAVYQRRQ